VTTPPSPDQLSRTIYDALHSLAERLLVEQRRNHTLQPTALVHEAYLRLQRLDGELWGERARFFAVAGKAMRSVLVDHARRRGAQKRGGGASAVQTVFEDTPSGSDPVDVLDLEEALVDLEKIDEGLVRVVELLFFAGLTAAEAAGVLGISERTVKRDWRTARTWLKARLDSGASGT
jgi:RNA polymerase sigma factor (TIGR02999 family)